MASTDPAIELARAAFGTGSFEAAASHAAGVLARDPRAIDAIEVLALVRREQGRLGEAEALLRAGVAGAPGRHWPYDDLARLLLAQGRVAEAEQVCIAAIAADPRNANAQAILGGLLSEREALVEGAAHLRAAIGLAGRHPELIADLGRNLGRQGHVAEAEALLREAIAGDREALRPRAWLAELLERTRRFEEAGAVLDAAEPIAARQGSDVTLQRAALLARTDRWRDGLALLDSAGALSGAALLQRGRLRDRAGRYDEAWADFVAGKAALSRAAGRSYPRAEVDTLIASLRRFEFGAMAPAPLRADVPQPVFILGFPRSGTTLIEQVLASHSRIRAGGELPFVAELAEIAAARTRGWTAPDPSLPAALRDQYLARAEAYGLLAPGAAYFIDKMPLNELYVPLLALAFPQSPRVTMLRDPRDILVSAMSHDFTHGFDCGYRPDTLAHHLAAMRALAAHWRAELGGHALGYEALIADQAGETAALMAAIGLELEPAQARFYESQRVAPTPSYAQVQEPLNDRSIGRWRNYAPMLAAIPEALSTIN
jgi:tetratricopeptide (TPR) repeat protein